MDLLSPTQLAVQIWGKTENDSRSRGAREVRRIARELFPEQAPGMGGRWELTREMGAAIEGAVRKG